MSKPQIIYVHGWGLDKSFWDPLINTLPYKSRSLNLGYIGEKETNPSDQKSIYVTHSLGTMWALKNHAAHISTLIAINGFYNFKPFSDSRTLRAIKQGLIKNTSAQMKNFFKTAQIKTNPQNFNTNRLIKDLDMLATGDETASLKALSCPVFSLIGESDPILALKLCEKEWLGYDVKICQQGGHALPITHIDWCAEHIESAIKAHNINSLSV